MEFKILFFKKVDPQMGKKMYNEQVFWPYFEQKQGKFTCFKILQTFQM
jgi:hypothetical protein